MKAFIKALHGVLLVAMASASLSVGAAPITGDPLRDGIDLYKMQKFDEASRCFEECIAENPNDPRPHYYLANCYLGLGKYDLADKGYQICLKFQPPPEIAAYATKMHNELQKRIPAAGGADPGPPPTAVGAFNQRRFDEEVDALKRRNHEQMTQQANAKIQTLTAQIDRLQREVSQQQEQDPMYFYRRGYRRLNPSAAANQALANAKLNQLREQIGAVRRDLRNRQEKLDSQIDNTFSELASQARATTGNIKPVLTSRSIYVRDYVHFNGDDPPPDFEIKPMRATPGKYVGPTKP